MAGRGVVSRSEKLKAATAHGRGVDVVLRHSGGQITLSFNPRQAPTVAGAPNFRPSPGLRQSTVMQWRVGSSALARQVCRWAGHLVVSGAVPDPVAAVQQAIATETAGWVHANRRRGIRVTP